MIEHVAGALGEQVEQVAARSQRQTLRAARRLSTPGTGRAGRRRRWAASRAAARAAHRRRRRASRNTPAAPRHRAREKRATSACVAASPPPTLMKSSSGSGRKLAHRPLDDAQAVLGEPQVADDLRMQQADRVTRGRIAEARMEFLGDGGAAEDAATLEHRHRESGRGEVAGADQAVVAAADDDGIVAGRGMRHGVGFLAGSHRRVRERGPLSPRSCPRRPWRTRNRHT